MEDTISASGERAAIGGYLPQFDEFAWFVYLNLINRELEWVRIADPNAEKLDDIQYATSSEIHAYQVKWTISEANISYKNFIELFPAIISSWKSIKTANREKKVFAHLITNKELSSHDIITNGSTKIGSFKDFIPEVWRKIKAKQKISDKWIPIVEELKKISTLNDVDFLDILDVFDFNFAYQKKNFSIENVKYSKEDEDLQQVSRLIMEQVASPEKRVEFSRQEIIQKLGWQERFKTNFNHELVIDRRKYQPIQSTIDKLNLKLSELEKGYVFLQGGPGSGKSTLLNQWSKQLRQRVVRYYAFDFVNPSSPQNFYERGNATYLLFDLVFQLKEAGIYKRNILPYKDILFLKDVFSEQLKSLGEEYVKTGQSSVIIIDGLDHVPREYQSVTNSFLRELPLPSTLPNGVFIILGSQTYELADLQQEIVSEFKRGDRVIQIDPLKKDEVYKYIEAIDSFQLSGQKKQKIYEKSQGHPLYLSYLIEKILRSESIDETIESFETIDGDIENYYRKIWTPIEKEEKLVQLLGLLSRIRGVVNLNFISEWNVERDALKLFRDKAKVLFNENKNSLSFFHNSYRQFLLYHTAINYLTDKFDSEIEVRYHAQLANFYKKSKVENVWKQNYHLYQSKKYAEFISLVTPECFVEQLLNYRPIEEIKQDAKLGIEIAKQTKNISLLIRYLFALAELQRRHNNVDPASFTEELLLLNNFDAASRYLRTDNILHCSRAYALKASRLYLKYGYNSEALVLYNLAYPDVITDDLIYIDDSHRYDEIKGELEAWISTASYFETIENILHKIGKISFSENMKGNQFNEEEHDLFISLLIDLAYSLIEQSKWNDFDVILNQIDITTQKGRNLSFELLQDAIIHCLDLKDNNRANDYLSRIKNHFAKEETKAIGKIYIANLIYKVTEDKEEVIDWIKDIEQPLNFDAKHLDYDGSLDSFIPLIQLNRLLNLCGKSISITSAIPTAIKGSDEEILVEFQRMLCLIVKIQADGMLHSLQIEDISKRIYPIVRFYYKNVSHRNMYWYKLTKCKGEYFDFLIHSVSLLGVENLNSLAHCLFEEFDKNAKYWGIGIRREIIMSLSKNGLDIETAKEQLLILENESMFEGHDMDGRISECIEHSKAWLNLKEYNRAEQWLKQTIQESIGVGYRKDYQFSTWIGWLRKINEVNPENAPERIKWFLSHLKYIKETTEGRAYWNASEELLEATFEYNLYDGFQQTIWQLSHDLIDFTDSISLFIKYFIKRVQNKKEFSYVAELYCNLYLLLAEQENNSLLKDLLSKGYELYHEDFLCGYLEDIISAINIKAYEISRYYLLNEIVDFFLAKGIDVFDYSQNLEIPIRKQRVSSSDNSNILVLSEQKSLDESVVAEKSLDFEELKRLLHEEANNSYFKWQNILDKIIPSLSVLQLEEICDIDKKGRRGSDFYAILSKAAFTKGATKLAEKLAERSLDLSSESGWVKHYDGGTRIAAFNALRKIDSKKYSEKAFEVFAHDIVNTNYPSLYIEEIEDIIPLLSESYNIQEIWIEIFGYLKRLMSNSNPIDELPAIDSIDKPITETLIDYLMYLSDSPVAIIKKQSILLLARYIDMNNDYLLRFMSNEITDDYLVTDIIVALYELKSNKIKEFVPEVTRLSTSKDYHIRDNARRILYMLEKDIPEPKFIELPLIYTLHIPEPAKPSFDKEIDPYFPDVDLNDPRDLIKPFEYYISILSKESGVDEYKLILRVHSIMKELGNEKEWTKEFEKELRYHLEEVNLKYSYPRPRVIAAQKGIMHVVSELIDSGTIYEERIAGLFKLRDNSVIHFSEIAKPSFIQTIQEKEYGGVSSDWVDRINESSRLCEQLLAYKQNFKIIAEYTCVKNLDWGAPTEEYMYQIAVSDIINENDYYIFGSLFHQLSDNYHNLTGGGHSIIVIRDHRFNQFDLKSKWIAINPVLARYLGWVPEPTKLFAWKDSNGELMAESIYWLNGNVNMVPRKDGEVGEGWFVVLSESGLEQIKVIEKNLHIQKKLIRTKSEDAVPKENQVYNVIKL